MAKNPMRNIRISDDVWNQAKMNALKNHMTLQDWVTYALIKAPLAGEDVK